MSALHTVNQSPTTGTALASCLRFAVPGAGIVLIEDAVVAALSESGHRAVLVQALGNHRIFVLSADLQARGLRVDELLEGIHPVDYEGFVDLCAEYSKVIAWY